MDIVADILENHNQEQEKFKSIIVKKQLDLEYDLGTLLCADNNELDLQKLNSKKDDYLQDLTRDNVQLLLNRIWELPTEKVDDVIVVKLPKPSYLLPRARHVPKPRQPTKWEQYAKLKGIQKKKKSKLSWDEQLQKWIPLYGYKKAEAVKNKDWLIEVSQNDNPMEDLFAKKTEMKSERVAKNELQRLRNIAKSKNIKVPRMGLLNPDVSSAKDLQAAVTVAKSSTASIGKFQNSLPKEKEARNVSAITPGASVRKRKAPPISSEQEKHENLNAIDYVLNKKPKLNVEKAVNRQINQDQVRQSEDSSSNPKPKAGNRGKKKGKNSNSSKKPKSGKGQKKGKGSGRKRR